MCQAKWLSDADLFGNDYQCIELYLANLLTLTRAKIIAADSAEFSGRTQVLPDRF